MEDSADEWLERHARQQAGKADDGGDDEPPPLRLNTPLWYALATWVDYQRGLLPRAGGLDDQDAAWYADMQAITARYNWHARRVADEGEDNGRERDLEIEELGAIAGVERADWRGLIGE